MCHSSTHRLLRSGSPHRSLHSSLQTRSVRAPPRSNIIWSNIADARHAINSHGCRYDPVCFPASWDRIATVLSHMEGIGTPVQQYVKSKSLFVSAPWENECLVHINTFLSGGCPWGLVVNSRVVAVHSWSGCRLSSFDCNSRLGGTVKCQKNVHSDNGVINLNIRIHLTRLLIGPLP